MMPEVMRAQHQRPEFVLQLGCEKWTVHCTEALRLYERSQKKKEEYELQARVFLYVTFLYAPVRFTYLSWSESLE